MAALSAPVRARYTAPATTQAPAMPSGWLWVTSAEALARARHWARLSAAQATGETRMALPLPRLP